MIELSDCLCNILYSLDKNIPILSKELRDEKLDEFNKALCTSKEQMRELSEKYYAWAAEYLQRQIEMSEIIDYDFRECKQ